MDELAAAIGMDPLEFRRKNYTTKSLGGTGDPYSSKGLDRCYDLGAEAIGSHRRNPTPGGGAGKLRRGSKPIRSVLSSGTATVQGWVLWPLGAREA